MCKINLKKQRSSHRTDNNPKWFMLTWMFFFFKKWNRSKKYEHRLKVLHNLSKSSLRSTQWQEIQELDAMKLEWVLLGFHQVVRPVSVGSGVEKKPVEQKGTWGRSQWTQTLDDAPYFLVLRTRYLHFTVSHGYAPSFFFVYWPCLEWSRNVPRFWQIWGKRELLSVASSLGRIS